MALSVVDLYQEVLPRSNCGDCGFPTCLAFASMVVSKVKSMRAHVEEPIGERFSGRKEALASAGKAFSGAEAGGDFPEADVALLFAALPRVPLLLLFWDAEPAEEIGARAKLLFDETVTVHLDIESILFLSEHLRRRLCGEGV